MVLKMNRAPRNELFQYSSFNDLFFRISDIMALIPPGNGINYQTLNRRRIVAIIGAGLFGRSLALRLNQCPDVIVRVGSRNPKEGQTTIREAVSQASIIFLTVPAHAHDDVAQAITPFIRENAIVVDVSNYPLTSPPEEGCPISIAERLQILFPSCRVVKGFNTVSSYELATCHSTPTVSWLPMRLKQ